MATPFLTLELSHDEESVFIYSGAEGAPGMGHDRELIACVGRQREDFEYQIQEYVAAALRDLA